MTVVGFQKETKMGEKNKGFNISLDTARHIFKLRLWGRWDMKMGKKYLEEFQRQIKKLNQKEKDWYLLVDLTEYLPQSRDIQNIISEGLALLKGDKIQKRGIFIHGPIIHFPIDPPSKESDMRTFSYFQSEDDAIRWLLNEPPDSV